MARPSGHQTMNPRTIRATVRGPHCGLIIAVFIFFTPSHERLGCGFPDARINAPRCAFWLLKWKTPVLIAAAKFGPKGRGIEHRRGQSAAFRPILAAGPARYPGAAALAR